MRSHGDKLAVLRKKQGALSQRLVPHAQDSRRLPTLGNSGQAETSLASTDAHYVPAMTEDEQEIFATIDSLAYNDDTVNGPEPEVHTTGPAAEVNHRGRDKSGSASTSRTTKIGMANKVALFRPVNRTTQGVGDVPYVPDDVSAVQLILKLPNGRRRTYVLRRADRVGLLLTRLHGDGWDMSTHTLRLEAHKASLVDYLRLQDEGIQNEQVLVLERYPVSKPPH